MVLKFGRVKYYVLILWIWAASFEMSAQAPLKQVLKSAGKIWDTELSAREIVLADSSLVHLLKQEDRIFTLFSDSGNRKKGYAFLTAARGRYEPFDYFIIYDTSLTVQQVKVTAYRSSHGGAIAGKRWLKQFSGYHDGELKYGRDIQALSGATISGNSIVEDIRRAGSVMRSVTGVPGN